MSRTENFVGTTVRVAPKTLQECIETLLKGFNLPDEAVGRSIDISDVATEAMSKYTDSVSKARHKQELLDFLQSLQKENTLREQNTFVLPFCGVEIEIRNKKNAKRENRLIYMAPSPINVIKPSTKNVLIVTPQSPLYQKLLKRKLGDTCDLYEQIFEIKKLLSPQEIELILISMIIKD